MPVTQDGINSDTPMGANLTKIGATFRVWAPGATAVYVALNADATYTPAAGDLLVKNAASGHWTGFISGVTEGTAYRYWIVGAGSSGFKRDPYARELRYPAGTEDYANSNCIIRDPDGYQWVSSAFSTPAFNQLVVYQFHIGVYFAEDQNGNDMRTDRVSKLFDAHIISILVFGKIDADMELIHHQLIKCRGAKGRGDPLIAVRIANDAVRVGVVFSASRIAQFPRVRIPLKTGASRANDPVTVGRSFRHAGDEPRPVTTRCILDQQIARGRRVGCVGVERNVHGCCARSPDAKGCSGFRQIRAHGRIRIDSILCHGHIVSLSLVNSVPEPQFSRVA